MDLNKLGPHDVVKPCVNCGCEISPLKTNYGRARRVCDTCSEKKARLRDERHRARERSLAIKLGVRFTGSRKFVEVPRCQMCTSQLPAHKSHYCSVKCSQDKARMDYLTLKIGRQEIRIEKERKVLKKRKREYQKLVEELEMKRGAIKIENEM